MKNKANRDRRIDGLVSESRIGRCLSQARQHQQTGALPNQTCPLLLKTPSIIGGMHTTSGKAVRNAYVRHFLETFPGHAHARTPAPIHARKRSSEPSPLPARQTRKKKKDQRNETKPNKPGQAKTTSCLPSTDHSAFFVRAPLCPQCKHLRLSMTTHTTRHSIITKCMRCPSIRPRHHTRTAPSITRAHPRVTFSYMTLEHCPQPGLPFNLFLPPVGLSPPTPILRPETLKLQLKTVTPFCAARRTGRPRPLVFISVLIFPYSIFFIRLPLFFIFAVPFYLSCTVTRRSPHAGSVDPSAGERASTMSLGSMAPLTEERGTSILPRHWSLPP